MSSPLDQVMSAQVREWLAAARDRLLFLPALFTAGGALLAVGLVTFDEVVVAGDDLPRVLRTTVDGGRGVLSTIATGLIAAYTLLLSLLLVAIQLAANQFSPRTVGNWLADRVLQRAIGLALGTVTFCLVVLYQTRGFDDADDLEPFEPHVSVLVAILLAVASLVVVLRAVDHLADSMRVGAVVRSVVDDTVQRVRKAGEQAAGRPRVNPATRPTEVTPDRPPPGAHVVEAPRPGWVQEIDVDRLLAACPEDATVRVPVAVGAFVPERAPLAWVEAPPPGRERIEELDRQIHKAFAIGDNRTMRQDPGLGFTRLVDIGLRALSPSLNDANTAKDVIAHLGQVVLAVFEQPERGGVHRRDRREVVLTELSHQRYLTAAFDQIRKAAAAHPQVLEVLLRTLFTVRAEVERRQLPARPDLIDDLVVEITQDVAESGELTARERERVLELVPGHLRERASA